MSEIDGGRLAARQLKAAGIDTIFGVVAGPTVQIMSGAQAEGLRVISCRHEENGAFMPPPGVTSRRSPASWSQAPARARPTP